MHIPSTTELIISIVAIALFIEWPLCALVAKFRIKISSGTRIPDPADLIAADQNFGSNNFKTKS